MEPPNCLNDSAVPVVADASVVINLNASGYVDLIMDALPNRMLITEGVADEVERGQARVSGTASSIADPNSHGWAETVTLSPAGMRRFRGLAEGSAGQTLGDGEAATIASALDLRAIALIDERKALRICSERFPNLLTGVTLDVFTHHRVKSVFGRELLSEAVFNALSRGRMRVPTHYLQWVVDLIGASNAVNCRSLPRSVRQPSGGLAAGRRK